MSGQTNGHAASVNGHSEVYRKWAPGPGAPLTTPFNDDQSVNHPALAQQVVRVAQTGTGIVLLGTTGEANSLSDDERVECVRTARTALDGAGLGSAPLMVGTGSGSAYSTIQLTKRCADAGATHALVVLPGFFTFHMGSNRAAIMGFFSEVLDSTPLPIMIYSFPGPSGVDLSSSELIAMSDHRMCFGVKLTCAIVGKGQRLATHTGTTEYRKKHAVALAQFTTSGDFQILQVMIAGHNGFISGFATLFPKLSQRLYQLSLTGLAGDRDALREAIALQSQVAECENILGSISFSGLKYALDLYVQAGLGGDVRSPLPRLTTEAKMAVEQGLAQYWKMECEL